MLKRFSLMKGLFSFIICFLWQFAFAEGILVFEVTDPLNKPIGGIKINVDGENIASQVLETDAKGRYMNAKFPTGTYTYDVQYGDWAKGRVTVPDAEFGWVSVNFRELRVHFMDDKGNNLADKSVKIYHVGSDGKDEYITTKVSDTTGIVLFTLPEGEYKYETLKGVEKVTLDDKTKTAEVPVNSGIIAHQTYFEFQRDSQPVKLWAMDINIFKVDNGKQIPYGSVDAHGNIDKKQYVQYDRTENKISMAAGTYIFSVATKDYGTLQDTFYVDDNCSIDNYIVPINLNTLDKEDEGEEEDPEEEKEEPDTDILDSLLTNNRIVNIELNIFDEENNPIDGVFTFVEMTNISFPFPFVLSDENGQCTYSVPADSSYIITVANDKIAIDSIQNDTVINWTLARNKYTELYFKLRYDNDLFNPTTVSKVDFEAKYETDSFYRTATFVILPEKNPTNDTLYYTKPLKVGAMDFSYYFSVNEMRHNGNKSGRVKTFAEQETQYAIYNLEPVYYFKAIVCKPDTVSRFFNSFKLDVKSKTAAFSQSYSTTTDENGEYSIRTSKADICVTALQQQQCLTVESDTTIYFIYDEDVQNVYFRFLHGGEIVNPQVMNLTVYEIKDGNRIAYSSLVSDKDTKYDNEKGELVTKYIFKDSMNVPNGHFDAEYTLKDYYYNGKCTWPFDIVNARGTDTTIYIVIPVKRNVEITISDASGEKVEGVFAQIYKYDDTKKVYDLNSTSYDGAEHGMLRTNANGIIHDHLLPGRYQLRILDIVRNFIVGDYDLSFDILKGEPLKNVKFIVKNKNTEKPMQGLELTVTKEGSLYSTDVTSNVGEIDMECEEGTYTYSLNYGVGHTDTYTITKDTIIFIYVEDEVKVKEVVIDANDCVANGESVLLSSDVSPKNATRGGLVWSVNNNVLGTVDNTGKFTANAIGITGFVTIKATSTDGTNISAEKLIQVGGAECGASIQTLFEDGKDEIKRTDDSLKISITPGNEEFERCYAVQEKRGEKWILIAGPTKDTTIFVSTVNMNEKEHIIRVISSTDCDRVAKGDIHPEDPQSADKVGGELKINNSSIFFKSGVSGVCEKQDNVLVEIDGEDLNALAGVDIVWYSQKNSESSFTEIVEAKGKTSATINVSETTTIKVVLENGSTVLAKAQKVIVAEDSLKIKISSDKSVVCLGDEVTFDAQVVQGESVSLLWEDGTSSANRSILADTVTYVVEAESKLGYCPNAIDSIKLNVDLPIVATLNIDKAAVCDNANNITLTVSSANKNKLNYSWTGFAEIDLVLTDAPTLSRDYEVVLSTELGICPDTILTQSVTVAGNVDFKATAKDNIFCKDSDVEISITKINEGQNLEDIEFSVNGVSFEGNTTKVSASDTVFAILAVDKSGGCPDAVDTVRIKIDEPVAFAMWQSAKAVCSTGSDSVTIKAIADAERNYNYVWNNGASDSIIKVYPQVDTIYSVEVRSEYNRCPSISDNVSVNVNENIKVTLTADVSRICQSGDENVTLTAEAENGNPSNWIWWDGAVTTSPERMFLPSSAITVWVRGNDNVCAVSDTASLTISVDVPHNAHIATTSTKFVYGGSIDLVASFDGAVRGPLYWYSENNDGDVSYLGETEELKFSDMPSDDATYYFVAKNGACPDVRSESIKLALTDDIEIPTVFTPFERNGENDEFMLGYDVVIYDRFGNLIHRGSNGWDGTYRGAVADAGVYIYTLTLKDGREKKGTIQVFKRD